MPLRPFELSKQARRRRRDFKVFICSALIGTSLGILVSLLVSFPFTKPVLYEIAGMIIFTLILIFYTMKVVLKPDDVHHILTIYLAYSKDKGMFVPITNRLGFIMQGYMRVRDGAKSNPEPIKILKSSDIDAIEKLAMDLVIYELFDWLSCKYRCWWAPKIRYTGIAYGRWGYKSKNEVDSEVFKYSDLPEEMRKNNLFFRLYGESLMSHHSLKFSVPKCTKFRWTQQNKPFKKSTISLSNKYCNLKLSVSPQGWGAGLHPLWGKFVVAKDRDKDDSFIYLQQHYAHIVLEMELHASFSWFWSLKNSSDDYFNWVEDMRDGLDDFFSFEREYEALEQLDEKFILD